MNDRKELSFQGAVLAELQAIRQELAALRCKDAAADICDPDAMTNEQAYRMHYRGNSVDYVYRKLDAYKSAIDGCFDELRAFGVPVDGRTSLREYLRRLLNDAKASERTTDGTPDASAIREQGE